MLVVSSKNLLRSLLMLLTDLEEHEVVDLDSERAPVTPVTVPTRYTRYIEVHEVVDLDSERARPPSPVGSCRPGTCRLGGRTLEASCCCSQPPERWPPVRAPVPLTSQTHAVTHSRGRPSACPSDAHAHVLLAVPNGQPLVYDARSRTLRLLLPGGVSRPWPSELSERRGGRGRRRRRSSHGRAREGAGALGLRQKLRNLLPPRMRGGIEES